MHDKLDPRRFLKMVGRTRIVFSYFLFFFNINSITRERKIEKPTSQYFLICSYLPVSTRRHFDVHTTSITLKRRRMDAKTTSCASGSLTEIKSKRDNSPNIIVVTCFKRSVIDIVVTNQNRALFPEI